MHCQHCQTENRAGVKFCENCGERLLLVCPGCQDAGPPGRKFCGSCGYRFVSPTIDRTPNPDANTNTVTAADPAPSAIAAKTAAPAPNLEAGGDRRNITVMFCDLVGSTELAQHLDPEDLSNIIRQYTQTVSKVCGQFGGHVARFLGDGVLTYFGYPAAFENSAERSIRAALSVINAVSNIHIDDQATLRCRIGIAYGEVVTGETVESAFGKETLAIGKTPNLAARLQGLAQPDSILVDDTVRSLTRSLFDFDDGGKHKLKGFSEVMRVWKVNALLDAGGKPLAPKQSSKLVARDEEITRLMDCWNKSRNGSGQVVHVQGEAGIGKSRLIQAVQEQLAGEAPPTTVLECSSIESATVLHPFLYHVMRTVGIASSDNAATRRGKLTTYFANNNLSSELIEETFAQLVGLTPVDTESQEQFSPRQQKLRTLNALNEWLSGLCANGPALLIVEDLHWADPTTLEWLGQAFQLVAQLPVCILTTSREEAPWLGMDNFTEINLGHLQRKSAETIIANLTNGKPLPREVMDLVVERTDGVPLFVEAFTRTILESGLLRDTGTRLVLDGPLPTVGIPLTLQDSLMARLDKSPRARSVAQVASVIGREFLVMLLEQIDDKDSNAIRNALSELADAELAQPADPESTTAWVFKHALVRDAAYKSLLRGRRRELHEKIAVTLSQQAPELLENRPELFAHHWSEATRYAESVPLWHKAARNAANIWANAESVSRYRRALEDLKKIPVDDGRLHEELIMQLELGDALRSAQGSSAADTNAAYRRAASLCEKTGDTVLLLRARYGEFVTNFMAARLEQAKSAADALLTIGEQTQHPACAIAGHQATGMYYFTIGELATAKQHLEIALELDASELGDKLDIQYPALSQSYLSWTLHILGDKDAALTLSETSINEARSRSPYDLAVALANACYLHQFRNDFERITELAQELCAIAQEKAMPAWEAVAEFFTSLAACETRGHGATTQNKLDRLNAALKLWAEDEIETPYFKCIVGYTLFRAGKVSEGALLIEEARELMQKTGEIWYENALRETQMKLTTFPEDVQNAS